MVEVENVRWGRVDGLPFWLLVLSSEAALIDMSVLWVSAMRNQGLWAYLSLSMFWESRERSRKGQSSRDSLTHWALDTALIGRMADRGEGIVTRDCG